MKNFLYVLVPSLTLAGVVVLMQPSCGNSRSQLPLFIVTEEVISTREFDAFVGSAHQPSELKDPKVRFNIINCDDKRVMWAAPKDSDPNNELAQIVDLPDYVGSPVGFLRLIVQHSGVAIRTYGTRITSIGPKLTLPDYGLDFDSTIHIPGRKATLREHIANCIPLSYKRMAVKIQKLGEVFAVEFSGMPDDLFANNAQRKAEGNPLGNELRSSDDSYYAKYSYEGR